MVGCQCTQQALGYARLHWPDPRQGRTLLLGEDNEWVLGELLGFGTRDIAELAEDGVI